MAFHIVDTRVSWLPEENRPAAGDILVIPANEHLWMGSGPGLEFKKEFGKEIELEAVRQGPIAPGEIAATPGDMLGYRLLLHAAVLAPDMTWVQGAATKAVAAFVRRAEAEKVRSVVCYPLYRGVHGDQVEPAKEMLAGLFETLEQGTSVTEISVLVSGKEEQALLQDLFLQRLRQPG